MKRIAVLALLIGSLFIATPAQAAEPTCDVQPIVAGECVTQPVADFVVGQFNTILSLQANLDTVGQALYAEQAAHQETRLLLTEAYGHITYLQNKLAKKQQTILRLRLVIAELRASK